MKTVSYHLGLYDNIDDDILIIFDPHIYNNINNEYLFRTNNINYNKTPIYVKPGIIINSYPYPLTVKRILISGYELSIRDINKKLLNMSKLEAMCYLEIEGYTKVDLDTDVTKI